MAQRLRRGERASRLAPEEVPARTTLPAPARLATLDAVFGTCVGLVAGLAVVELALRADVVARTLAPLTRYVAPVLVVAGVSALVRRRSEAEPDGAEPDGAEPRWRWPALVALAVVCFVLPLFHQWSTATTNPVNTVVGGSIPWSDGELYHSGAHRLAVTGEVDAWNERRPVNVALLAVRLALGGDLPHALVLQAGIAGLVSLLAAREMARSFGRGAGLLMFAGLFWFAGPYLVTPLSEPLGFILGVLAFVTLWHAARLRSGVLVAMGIGTLGTAFAARAAAAFALPLLLVWGAVLLRRGRGPAWRPLAIAATGLVGAFAVSQVLFLAYGKGPVNNANGNFSLTAYAIATKGGGWTELFEDHPHAYGMEEEELNGFAYAKTRQAIRDAPLDTLRGLKNNGELYWRDLLAAFTAGAPGEWTGQALDTRFTLVMLLSGPLAVVLVARAWRRRAAAPELWMVGLVGLGVLVTHPLTWVDAGERSLIPVVAFLLAGALALVARASPAANAAPPPRPGAEHWLAPATAAVLVFAALAGPALVHAMEPRRPVAPRVCPRPERSVVTDLSRSTRIRMTEAKGSTFGPRVRVDDFVGDGTFGGVAVKNELALIEPPASLVTTFNLERNVLGIHWLIAPDDSAFEREGLVHLCARPQEVGFAIIHDVKPVEDSRIRRR